MSAAIPGNTVPPALPGTPPAEKPYTASTWDIHKWGMGAIAQYFMWKEFALAEMVLILSFGLDSVLVGWVFAAPRILDAFMDPVMGHLSDISNTRWGRRRPFLLVTSLLAAGLLLALYWVQPTWAWGWQFAFLATVLTLYYYVWGTYEMNRTAMSYELSDDYSVRSRIQAIGTWWMTLPQIVGSTAYWFIVSLSEGSKWEPGIGAFRLWGWEFPGFNLFSVQLPDWGTEVDCVRYVAMVCAGVILVFGFIPALRVKERPRAIAKKQHAGLIQCLRESFKNRPFVLVILLRLAQTMGTALYAGFSTFIVIYYVCGGDKRLQQSVMTIGGAWLGLAVASFVWPVAAPLTRRIGKRRGLILTFGLELVSAVTLPLILRPGWIWVLFFHMLVFIIPGSMRGMFLSSIMPDICDLDELRSGERREGLYSSVLTFINQLEVSLCTLMRGYMLAWAGFNPKLVKEGILPSQDVLHNMLWLGLTPLLVFVLVAFVITWFIPLTPELMAKVRAELDARRAAAAQKAAATA